MVRMRLPPPPSPSAPFYVSSCVGRRSWPCATLPEGISVQGPFTRGRRDVTCVGSGSLPRVARSALLLCARGPARNEGSGSSSVPQMACAASASLDGRESLCVRVLRLSAGRAPGAALQTFAHPTVLGSYPRSSGEGPCDITSAVGEKKKRVVGRGA